MAKFDLGLKSSSKARAEERTFSCRRRPPFHAAAAPRRPTLDGVISPVSPVPTKRKLLALSPRLISIALFRVGNCLGIGEPKKRIAVPLSWPDPCFPLFALPSFPELWLFETSSPPSVLPRSLLARVVHVAAAAAAICTLISCSRHNG